MDDRQDRTMADGGGKGNLSALETLIGAAEAASNAVRPPAAVTQEDLEATFADIAVIEAAIPQKKNATKRSIQRKTRLTAEEDALFLTRVEQSGKGQGAFIRDAMLYKTIQSSAVPPIVETACAAMLEYGSTQRKLAGLLVQTVKVNREFTILNPEQIDMMNRAVKQLCDIGDRVIETAEALNGNY